MNELLEIESERDRERGYGLRMVEAGSILPCIESVLVLQKYFSITNNHAMPVCCQSTQNFSVHVKYLT